MRNIMSYHYTPIRMDTHKNNDPPQMLKRMKRNWMADIMMVEECESVKPLRKVVWQFLLKINQWTYHMPPQLHS